MQVQKAHVWHIMCTWNVPEDNEADPLWVWKCCKFHWRHYDLRREWTGAWQGIRKILSVLKSRNVFLNDDKCVYKVTPLEFLGHLKTPQRIRPANSKIDALQKFREPKRPEEVRCLLGLVTYRSTQTAHLQRQQVQMESWTSAELYWSTLNLSPMMSRA